MSLCSCGDVGIYKCPRCALPYCSLSCYKLPTHSHCSEIFYREQVEKELMQRSASNAEKDKMLQVLQRQRCEEGQLNPTSNQDIDTETEDLSEIMANISLKSEKELWSMLSDTEKQAFFKSVKTGSISTLLKPRKLWWNKPTFVFKPTKSPKFSDIFSKDPSEYLKFLVLQAVLAHVHVELMYCDKSDVLPEYWSMFLQLWDYENPNVFNTVDAVCVSYASRSDTAGASQLVPITTVLENALKILKLRSFAVEKVCCDVAKILSKVHNISHVPDHKKVKKKLQFFASWSASEYGTCLLPEISLELEKVVYNWNQRTKTPDHPLEGVTKPADGSHKLIEELGDAT